MEQARGYKSQVVIDFEDAFGQDPATPAGILMPINSWDVKAERNLTTPQTITGSRNPVQPIRGNLTVGGNAVVPVDYLSFGWWLRAMFGPPTTTGTGPYVHTFKLGDTQPSLVACKKEVVGATSYYTKQNGIKISTLGLTVGGDGELTASLGVVGATEDETGTTAYDETPSSSGFARAQNFQSSITEGGSSIATVTQLAINANMGLDTSQYVVGGGGVLGDIPEGIVSVDGSLTALFSDLTLAGKAYDGTESALILTLTDGTHTLAVHVPELEYKLAGRSLSGPGGVMQELGFVGFFGDGADASVLKVVLTNSIASYA
jgi:hypothetical protein